MCGIAGIIAFGANAGRISERELAATGEQMNRRGPDGAGQWISPDGRVGLVHRRLAIIDLSDRASQPMLLSDEQLVITFNGEIYNYQALRSELEREGCVFRTSSDTEVLLQLYARHGAAMFERLRGMFAFGIWDGRTRQLLLGRDPYGIKPLYYATDSGVVRFASQVQAMMAGGAVSRARDPAAQVGFFLLGSVPEPFSTYRAIRALPAGCYLRVTSERVEEPRPYASIAAIWSDAERQRRELAPSEAERTIREGLRNSVAAHMIADVPVGAFLSSGVDSGALVALMSERQSTDLTTVTLRFAEFGQSADDEAPLAAEIAHRYGVRHVVRDVGKEEFERDLPNIFAAMDQPSIDGVNTWFVSKAAAELGLKVAVSGLGGDELFGGYSSFQDVPRIAHAMKIPASIPWFGSGVRRMASAVLPQMSRLHPKMAGLAEYGGSYEGAYLLKRGLFMPWELASVLPEDIVVEGLERLSVLSLLRKSLGAGPTSQFAKVATLEASWYMRNQLLRDTDWASMAHSLEVRVPLVDAVLLKDIAAAVLSLHSSSAKAVLADAPERPLPHEFLRRPKTGFSTPVQQWLRTSPELSSWRGIRSLGVDGCPWARRFAYCVHDRALGGS